MLGFWKSLTLLGKVLLSVAILASIAGLYLAISASWKNQGALEVTVDVQKRTIKNVETVNEADQELINRTPRERNADCLRWSRTPEEC